MTDQTIEDRIAQRARLESCAEWNEERALQARRRGDERDAQRHRDNAIRLRQR
jgi:hypothetical protein